jgi:hypothetical protein
VTVRHEGKEERDAMSIDLKPYPSRVITTTLVRAGFRVVALYGDLARRRFDPAASKDVVVIAQKARRTS